MKNIALPLLFLLLALPAVCQTTTQYTIPAGSVCYNSPGPEACTFYPDGIDKTNGFGRFQTGSNFTQLDFDSYNGEMCWNPFTYASSVIWQPVADTDMPVPPLPTPPPYTTFSNQSDVKFFSMSCNAATLTGGYTQELGHVVHAEVFAYSYVANYLCGGRVRVPCHQTRWLTVDGSFVEDIK